MVERFLYAVVANQSIASVVRVDRGPLKKKVTKEIKIKIIMFEK